MIITTHQPIFLPWPGFFHKAFHADTIVILDQVQFPIGRGWMNRNRLKSEQGELWLTVPVWKKGRGKQSIQDVEICDEANWRRRHLRGIHHMYANAPYRDDYLPKLESIYARNHQHLVDLNLDLIRLLWDGLGLNSRMVLQSELGISGKGSELLASICHALNADTYVTLPIVEKYLDAEIFRANNIRLDFTRFSPPIYPQLWGDFRYNLSSLDLLLNCDPKSRELIAQNE